MDASLYAPTYLILVTILTVFTANKYPFSYLGFKSRNTSYQGQTFLFALFLIFFIGLRPVSVRHFVDMANYDNMYNNALYGSRFWFDWNVENLIFDNLLAWMGSMKIDIDYFFLLMSLLYFGGILWACLKLFPKDNFLAFLMYLGAFSTFSFGTNGIKAGAAASLFLVAFAYNKENKIITIIFLLLSLGFHHSMKAPIVAFIIALYYKNPKLYLYGWLFCLLLAALHVTFFLNFFSSYTDEHGAGYLTEETVDTIKNVSGFRPDFILYSAVPIFLGYYLISKENLKSKTYIFLWQTYTLTNCVFLLCTYGSFINRIAYLSWLMLPFVLLYPFTNISWSKQQPIYNKIVVFGHLGFTLFMFFIYYGIF